jgi:hypothetical protein
LPETEFVSFLKQWIAKPFNQLPPEIQMIVWQWLPQRRDPRYLLPPRRFVSVWDDLDENERLKAARNSELAFELGFRAPSGGSRDIDAQFIDIDAWGISRFGSPNERVPPMEPASDGGDGPPPEIPAWLSPMELAAYAATNNPWLVARCAPDNPGYELDHLEFRAIHSRSLSPTKVLEKAADMLRAGKIVMTALRDGVRREMPAEDWRYCTFRASPVDKNALAVCDVTTHKPVAGWTNFLMSREHAECVRAALFGLEASISALTKGAAGEAPEPTPQSPGEPMTSGVEEVGAPGPGQSAAPPTSPEPSSPYHSKQFDLRFVSEPERLENLMGWAENRRSDGPTPSTDALLKAHRKDFDPIRGVNEHTMRPVRAALASAAEKNGGSPTQKRYQKRTSPSTSEKIPTSQLPSR